MKEPSKTNLLLPLGIGAGVLILLASMKNKASAATSAVSPPIKTGSDDAMLSVDEHVTPGQINPSPAPSYVPPVQRTADADDFNTEAQDEGMMDEQHESLPDSGDESSEDFSVESEEYSREQGEGYSQRTMPVTLPNQGKPTMRTAQRFMPGGKPSMRTPATAVNQSTAYRPGVYNPKQVRFDSRTSQPVNYRPGASHQPIVPPQAPIPAMVKSNAVKAAPNANGKIFPLRMGMTNAYVKEVQRRIGVPATGYFGTMTLTALRNKYNVSEVSEILYRQIISGKAVVVRRTVVKQAPQRKAIPKGKPARKTTTAKPLNRYKSKNS